MSEFHPIDMQTWPMAQAFHYYTRIAPTSYTINVNMDVTILRRELKKRGYKFFPAYLYLATRVISNQQELRIHVKDGVLGYWDTLTPAYPQFHADDKTTSLLWTEYNEKFAYFYNAYLMIRSSMDRVTVSFPQRVCPLRMPISFPVFHGLLLTAFLFTIMELRIITSRALRPEALQKPPEESSICRCLLRFIMRLQMVIT